MDYKGQPSITTEMKSLESKSVYQKGLVAKDSYLQQSQGTLVGGWVGHNDKS